MAHTILYFIETNYLLPVGAIESLGWQSFLAVSPLNLRKAGENAFSLYLCTRSIKSSRSYIWVKKTAKNVPILLKITERQ